MTEYISLDTNKRTPSNDLNSTKPLYISKVTITSSNEDLFVSDSFLKSLLNPVLSTPLQNLKTTLQTFENIEDKLYQTDLFEDVKISLDTNQATSSKIKTLFDDISVYDIKVDSPIPITANIFIKPNKPLVDPNYTWTISNNKSIFSWSKNWINSLNRADQHYINASATYDLDSTKWKNFKFDGLSTYPLVPFTSVKSVSGISLFKPLQQSKDYIQYLVESGFRKDMRFPEEVGVKSSNLYTGLAINGAIKDEGNNNCLVLNKTILENMQIYKKTSILSKFSTDSRIFVKGIPRYGSYFNIYYEYVLNGLNDSKKLSPELLHLSNVSRFGINFEKYFTLFQDAILCSLLVRTGTSIKPSINMFNWETKRREANEFPVPSYLEERPHEKNDGIAFYNVCLNASVPLFSKCKFSPLRFQNSIQLERYNNCCPHKQRKPDITGTLGLVYKSESAYFDIGYTLPIGKIAGHDTKAGFAMNASISFL
ncbi:hypothetical protein TBLA_0A02810 [Henningerozyma blattae CBS 6284]|uniref:Bacterial surface antigen (D15) domain-containing protein n=1 Tax=Henningerozyma blattae (strain ATCC 34711 / CBS 6284 / DSM 70876 / NBRC 10599 / NRRL Y-10934 / UCD 77-7) TaxID=1071380 RepID=I2GVC7_HENB6|nr:hypothetical protein TBLA_0A02810 [Tetrapisispora blattae CBS 6284]CCH58079.1 hypothetical protein TBLA_0A02810 [Tetrapisispora blattae CBS 6284]